MSGLGILLIVLGVLLIWLTYTRSTGQFIGAVVNPT